jgi:hypothetical protein
MKLEVFQFLCIELKTKGLKDSRYGITVEEQVAMFLFTVAGLPAIVMFRNDFNTLVKQFHDIFMMSLKRLID